MYKIKVNDVEIFIEVNQAGKTLKGTPFSADIRAIKKNQFHVLRNNRSYVAEVIEANQSEKSFLIKINNHQYAVSVKDKYDELLHEMGFDAAQSKKVGDVKAPMPGLVLSVNVAAGQSIKTGDAIVILEAMNI